MWGRVTAYVTSFVADGGTELPDGTPDAIPLDGTITLTPTVGVMVFPTLTPPQQAVIQSLQCPIIGGVLYAPGTTPENVGDRDPGVILVASEQPLGLPDRVQYNVTWALEGARVSPPPVTIDVPSQATVDLATVIPATPGPGTVIVVSTVDRERAEDAAVSAANSAGSAFDDAAIAQGARLGAEAARGAAEGFAGDAETARDQAVTAAAGVAQHGRIQYDAATGRYTNDSLEGFFASRATPDSYGISIPKGLSTACMKTGANAGVSNPVLSTATQRGNDPYTAHSPFFTLEVNGGVEPDGTHYVTAVQGDARFKRDGSNGDVWIMAPVLHWRTIAGAEDVTFEISDSPLAGFTVQPKGLLPSGARRPYMLYAKYALSIVDGMARSISGQPVAVRNVSPNSLITQCKNATTGYSGKSFADDWYMKIMFLLKYATKNSQSVFAGVTSMYSQPLVTTAESETNRVVVATSAAALIPVGATITLGTNVPASTDRAPAVTFDIFDMRRVVDKVAVDSSNTALVVEGPRFTVQMGYRVYTMPWATGGCDRVVGDGSPTSPTNGREPFVLQGIEMGLGMYESLGDVILSNLGSGQEVCLLPDSRLAATSVTANYRRTGKYLPNQAAAGWTYPTYPTSAEGLLFGADVGASTSTGMCDGQYLDAITTQGTRQWLSPGFLGEMSNAGLWLVHARNALSTANWSIGSRLSAIGRGGETP